MTGIAISGTGLYTPEQSVSNEELVKAFNAYVENFNRDHKAEIEAGDIEALTTSSVKFIEKASGIKARYVIDKSGIIDPDVMCPRIPERSNDEISILAEMAVNASKEALAQAGRSPQDVDAVLVACSNLQRPYPAIAIEVQEALGIEGFGFDMNVACSSATFGVQAAADMISLRKCQRRAGRQPRDLYWPFELQRPRQPLYFRRCRNRDFAREERKCSRLQRVRNTRHQTQNQVFKQYQK